MWIDVKNILPVRNQYDWSNNVFIKFLIDSIPMYGLGYYNYNENMWFIFDVRRKVWIIEMEAGIEIRQWMYIPE